LAPEKTFEKYAAFLQALVVIVYFAYDK